ncbi:hypothetical protein [Halomicronema sp. CCY15110]|uniref:hypothetical protein n=1 Tax=Halomicronema sp. CCY15110 TaxID=2767773 RepID=UPI0019511216|nr:hypothetical protein [Halomicronema sp. CCY15110]
MQTLIITVGTRQVGWRCQDGIVRSLGADGDRGYPPHIDQLYAEFDHQRGYHSPEAKPEYRWAARHLGELIYRYCEQRQDFSAVVLPMDEGIIESQIQNGLTEVILWGTDQLEGTAWSFRRGDTCWLAKLMAGKLQQSYPDLQIQVWNPVVAVNQVAAIQQHLQGFLVTYALKFLDTTVDEPLTLQIQTKGSAPQIANSLEICAAALMRQCTVEQVIPIEPNPLFEVTDADAKLSQTRMATGFNTVNLGEYFWPVERERILSAWERGDFAEARVWLSAHRDRYQAVYDLAGHLALAINWQLQDALKKLQDWLNQSTTKRNVDSDIRRQWLKDIEILCKPIDKQTPEGRYLSIWESRLLIHINLNRQSYTSAFLQFVQVIERLLFWCYRYEDWISQGYVTPPENKCNWGVKKYKATFWDLRQGWRLKCQLPEKDPIIKKLESMNDARNDVVHRNEAIAPADFGKWLEIDESDLNPDTFYQRAEDFLQQFCPPDRPMPDRSLLQDLYHWGIEQLQA